MERFTLKVKPYDDYEPEILRRHISYLMQQSDLFGESIEDNMIFRLLRVMINLIKTC